MACRWRTLLATVFLMSGLSACGFVEKLDFSFSQAGCVDYPKTRTGAVNWDTARPVTMRIRQGEYWPMVLGFTAERPYVLRIENADSSDRMFRASGFFDSIAVGLVRVGGTDYETTCLSAITIGPRETAEIWFVAKRDGRYEFEDQWVPYLFSQGASGVIHISNARTRHISPVSFLVVPESVPTAPFLAPAKPVSAPFSIPAAPLAIPAAPRSSGSQPPPPVAAPYPAVSPEVSPAPLEIPAAPSDNPFNIPADKPAKTPAKQSPEKKASFYPQAPQKMSLGLQAHLQVQKPGFWQSFLEN